MNKISNSGHVTLSGSSETVAEYFFYAVNSILYQRGIYAADSFIKVKKYGIQLLVSSDLAINSYLEKIKSQMIEWMNTTQVKKFELLISSIRSKTLLEKWIFDIEAIKQSDGTNISSSSSSKTEKQISQEIGAVIRQIIASVTFLPLLDEGEPCSFDLHIFTDKSTKFSDEWARSQPKYVQNSETVRLRSFSTTFHQVDTAVKYKVKN